MVVCRKSWLGQLFATVLAVSYSAGVKGAGPERKPNIVIIYADDLGYGEISCQNEHALVQTPHTDALAASGIRFTDGHSGATTCTPSRYTLLTGTYSFRTKFPGGVCRGFARPVVPSEVVTLPELLQENGYHTGMVGKWHLGIDYQLKEGVDRKKVTDSGMFALGGVIDWEKPCSGGPIDNGFDYYFGEDCINYGPFSYIENQHVVTVPSIKKKSKKGPMWVASDFKMNEVLTKDTEKAVEYIQRQSKTDKPFFLYFAQPSPHSPHAPSPEFKGKSGHGAYYDYVMQSDWSLGQVVKAIDEAGIRENTLIIFSSDNGTEAHGYDYNAKHPDYHVSGPLRGLKRDLWEGGHRVPFITSWKGTIAAGKLSDDTVGVVDFMASFAELIGAELPEGSAGDSMSVLPALLGTGRVNRTEKVPYIHNYGPKIAIRKGDWVYIDSRSGGISKGKRTNAFLKRNGYELYDFPAELFNVKKDVSQHHNLYGTFPEKVKTMKAELERLRRLKATVQH